MPKLIDEHKCDDCNDSTWFVRLAEPQPVRVAATSAKEQSYMAYADYALIKIHNGTYGKDEKKHFSEVSVWAADEDEKSFPGCIYHYNRPRTLEEIIWTLGGEYADNRPEGKLNGTP